MRTPSQVVSDISVVASIGSILIGLLLVRQYRVRPRDNAEEAVRHRFHAFVSELKLRLFIWIGGVPSTEDPPYERYRNALNSIQPALRTSFMGVSITRVAKIFMCLCRAYILNLTEWLLSSVHSPLNASLPLTATRYGFPQPCGFLSPSLLFGSSTPHGRIPLNPCTNVCSMPSNVVSNVLDKGIVT